MSKESDMALAQALRAIADTLVMSAATRAGIPPALATFAPEVVERGALKARKPVKRAVSKYHKELGKVLKELKKKHPRTKHTQLMKKAHSITRRRLK